ncbi:putative actin-like protein [Hamiltosporidium magnivora]|uniref:Putative actin-like protein n=1 Tax=Hamiltosporidium magnivora TaxID=148818 RepID=A0A4V2JVR1_9MICR|nr:putative actin-like protein [Hamiltosporidium magnivora]
MFISIDEIHEVKNFYASKIKYSDTIIIDNGSYLCKSGYSNSDKQLVFKNKYYKTKTENSIEHVTHASVKSMFDGDIITNFETAECIFDKIFEFLECKNVKNLILTECLNNPYFSKKNLIEMCFEVYNVEKLQIGHDFIYSYLFNRKRFVKSEKCVLIVSMGHFGTDVVVLREDRIVEKYKLNYGGKQCSEYLLKLLQIKNTNLNLKLSLKHTNYLLKYLRCALDYEQETLEMYKNLQEGKEESVVIGKPERIQTSNFDKIPKKIKKNSKFGKSKEKIIETSSVETTSSSISEESDSDENIEEEESEITEENYEEEINIEEENVEENIEESNEIIRENIEESNEKIEEKTKEDEKEERKNRMLYFSGIYRFKVKIEKCLKTLKSNFENLSEEYEKLSDINGYIEKIRNKYSKIKKEIKFRENIRNQLKNKKSREYNCKFKISYGMEFNGEEEETLAMKIVESEDMEMESVLTNEIQKYINILMEYDKNFKPFEYNVIEVLKGENTNLNGLFINIERLKAVEILFEPGIVNLTQPGLIEIFEHAFSKFEIDKIFVTGGFSKIENIEKRIYNEARKVAFNDIQVIVSEDPQYDSLKGACFSDIFPVITKEEYFTLGLDAIMENEHLLLQLLDCLEKYKDTSTRRVAILKVENDNKIYPSLIKNFIKIKYGLEEEVTKKKLEEAQLANLYNEIKNRKLYSKSRDEAVFCYQDRNVLWDADGVYQHFGKSNKTVDHLATRCEKLVIHDYNRLHEKYDFLADDLGLIYKFNAEIIPYVMPWNNIPTLLLKQANRDENDVKQFKIKNNTHIISEEGTTFEEPKIKDKAELDLEEETMVVK